MERVSPLIRRQVYNAEKTDPTYILSISSPSLVVDLDPGGVLEARCVNEQPILLQVDSCGSSGESFFSTDVYELLSVKFFNGPLHGNSDLPNYYTTGEVYEISFLLKETTNTTVDGQTFYEPICTDTLSKRLPPDLIVSILISPTSKLSSTNNSIIVDILSGIQNSIDDMTNNSGALVQIDSAAPLFPLTTSAREVAPSRFVYYVGSVEEPPCGTPVKHVVVSDIINVPAIFVEMIESASASSRVAVTLLRDVLSSTTVYQGRLYQIENKGVGGGAKESTSTAVESATVNNELIALIAVDLLLLGVVLVLVLTHYEIMVGPPRGLGGLNARVMWDSRSFAFQQKLKEMQAEDEEERMLGTEKREREAERAMEETEESSIIMSE